MNTAALALLAGGPCLLQRKDLRLAFWSGQKPLGEGEELWFPALPRALGPEPQVGLNRQVVYSQQTQDALFIDPLVLNVARLRPHPPIAPKRVLGLERTVPLEGGRGCALPPSGRAAWLISAPARANADMTLGLAFEHHLAIGCNVPINRLVALITTGGHF